MQVTVQVESGYILCGLKQLEHEAHNMTNCLSYHIVPRVCIQSRTEFLCALVVISASHPKNRIYHCLVGIVWYLI